MKRLGMFALLAAVAAALVVPTTAGASPGASAFVIEGDGTISPGLTLSATTQSGTLLTAAVGGVVAAPAAAGGIGACDFYSFNSSSPETVATGTGNVYETCPGGLGGGWSNYCSQVYTRVGGLVVLTPGPTACTAHAVGPTGDDWTTDAATGGVLIAVPTKGDGVTTPITGFKIAGFVVGGGPS